MSKHQLIYTNCTIGISGQTGQTIFSHSREFPTSAYEEIRGLYNYPFPTKVLKTSDQVGKLPSLFTYRVLHDSTCAIALNTVLDKNYVAEDSRAGTNISHIIVCDPADLKRAYPSEYYGGPTLRFKPPEEVSLPHKPAYLNEPDLRKGNVITEEKILNFLEDDRRRELYVKMVAAMLQYKETGKRVVIHDPGTTENTANVLLWIAALHYTLPWEMAIRIGFTTYAFDPSTSGVRICGVRTDGTDYSPNATGEHYIFDIPSDIAPRDLPLSPWLTHDTGPINVHLFGFDKDFHKFVIEKLKYNEVDERHFYDGFFSLYILYKDGPGANGMDANAFKKATAAWDIYRRPEVAEQLVEKLIAAEDFLNTSSEYTEKVSDYIVDSKTAAGKAYAESLIIKEVMSLFTSADTTEADFSRALPWYEEKSKLNKINLNHELMKRLDRDKLYGALSDRHVWKWGFALGFFLNYVASVGAANFAWDTAENRYIENIINLRYTPARKAQLDAAGAGNSKDNHTVVERILNQFATAPSLTCLINTAMTLEGFLKEIPDGDTINKLWETTISIVADKCMGKPVKSVYTGLLNCRRYDIAFDLYAELLSRAEDITMARLVYKGHFGASSEDYFEKYGDMICKNYYQYLIKNCQTARDKVLAKISMAMMIKDITDAKYSSPLSFIDKMEDHILADIPLKALNIDNQLCVKSLEIYHYHMGNKQPLNSKLMLLTAGRNLTKTDGQLPKEIYKLLHYYNGKKAISLAEVSLNELEGYLEWIAAELIHFCTDYMDLFNGYALFSHSPVSSDCLIGALARGYANTFVKENNVNYMMCFLHFIFYVAQDDTSPILTIAGENLAPIKKHIPILDEALATNLASSNTTWKRKWSKVKATAKSKK